MAEQTLSTIVSELFTDHPDATGMSIVLNYARAVQPALPEPEAKLVALNAHVVITKGKSAVTAVVDVNEETMGGDVELLMDTIAIIADESDSVTPRT